MLRHALSTAALFLTAALPSATDAAETACHSIPGAAALLRPGAIILLGELHGTAEAPQAVAELACEALAAGRRVIVGLELPQADQGNADDFMTSQGTTADRQRLLAGEFWQRGYQDGRTSAAMLELHARLGALAATSGDLDVVYIDDPAQPASRDHAMAQRILAARSATPEALIIALTGNLHNRLTRGTRWNPDHEPMGLFIAREVPAADLVSLEMTYGSGSAWICQGSQAADCGVAELGGRPAGGDGIVLQRDASDPSVSGSLYLGPITASPPAKQGAPVSNAPTGLLPRAASLARCSPGPRPAAR